MSKNITIILSTYNEKLSVEHTISELIKNINDVEIVVVDDNSPDGTFEILKKIMFLLKEKGMTINGVKKYLINKNSFDLDEFSNISINSKNNNLKSKIEKISKLVKEIKKLG